ncbi:SHOCT domain-containing protein [Pelotomaculum propionicicum]|jgi:hypothetical protein|uniref:SHOCT-like domain-containing protein n=1 Tax=Pelotomaculum propionicicum TaxID=258475 RepID=A0A4Y7RMZ5_9FIRM|nr:SHOCT domain-containing protein [Pelotomaculum propionicicum]NLI13802.1 hypothetical protein [Peptococcaceae bacterium]TEB10243.1 hypothetical protein Pmgp_02543 [Pelotomaculum propionicicum]
MSQTQIANEVKYRMAYAFLRKLLAQGLITDAEFEVAHRYTAERYKPLLKAV